MIRERAPDESFTSHERGWLPLWLRRREINVLIFRVRPLSGRRLTGLESRG
jgi:hypothetical protein